MSIWSPNGAEPPCPVCGIEGCFCVEGEEPTPGEHLALVLAARVRNTDNVSAVDDGPEDIDF